MVHAVIRLFFTLKIQICISIIGVAIDTCIYYLRIFHFFLASLIDKVAASFFVWIAFDITVVAMAVLISTKISVFAIGNVSHHINSIREWDPRNEEYSEWSP